MRKRIYIIGFAALIMGFLSTACADRIVPVYLIEKEGEETEKTMVFTATLELSESDPETKTSLSVLNVIWNTGDEIRIFNESTPLGAVFTLSEGAGTQRGTFTGPAIGDGPYYAVYPASATDGVAAPFTATPPTINAVAPVSQAYAANSFGPGANIAVAQAATKDDLSFRNVFGVVSFTLKGASTTKITGVNVYTRGADILNGALKITNLDGVPASTLTGSEESNKCVHLNCSSSDVALNDVDGVTFYIAVPAGAFEEGIYVEFIDNAGTAMVKASKPNSKNVIKRSGIIAIPSFTYAAAYKAAFLEETGSFGAFTNVELTGSFAKPFTFVPGGTSQYASTFTTTGDGTRTIRFQDWTVGYAVTLNIDKYNLPLNSTPSVAVKALGAT
ncbi:MAG: hypothetical protein J5835_01230, partial [Bacteroidales bacterium]|nr:hypothetical protein [Bacteroidales bacterium]